MKLLARRSERLLAAIIIATISVLSIQQVTGLRPEPRIDGSGGKTMKASQTIIQDLQIDRYSSIKSNYPENEIDDRIVLAEPYKSLIQSTARFAITQSKLANHVSVDTAMSYINDAGLMLSKPANIVKLVKSVAVAIVAFIVSTFLFPGAYRTIDAFWQDPIRTLKLDRYLADDINDRSVTNLLASKTDQLLRRVGLADTQCRELTVCYVGQGLGYVFPQSAETNAKLVSSHLAGFGIKDNKYINALTNGIVERNCTAIYSTNNGQSCLGNLFNMVVLPRIITTPQPKYQSIKVGKSETSS